MDTPASKEQRKSVIEKISAVFEQLQNGTHPTQMPETTIEEEE